MSPGKRPQTQTSSRYMINAGSNSTALPNGYSSRRNYLIKDHLQGIRVGIKNWLGCVSRYKHYRKDILSRYCEFVNRTWRAANFLYARWQAYEAGEVNCQGSRICPPKRSKESTSRASGYKLINGEKVSCHGE
jgi:hypothetical protein